MKSLRSRRKKVHAEAVSILKALAIDPFLGVPLISEMLGLRSLHFWNDKFRIVWEVDLDAERVLVHGVGRKESGIYDQVRSRLRGLRSS